MRTYGRLRDVLTGKKTWYVIQTDAAGHNDMVWLATLAQVCKLNLGESPFFANYGIPARQSVAMQIHPTLYMARTQQQFARYFMSLTMFKNDDAIDEEGRPAPYYEFRAITNAGAALLARVPF